MEKWYVGFSLAQNRWDVFQSPPELSDPDTTGYDAVSAGYDTEEEVRNMFGSLLD